jgi:hypothetical protein
MMEQSASDAFQKNPDGTWTSIKATTLKLETKTIAIPMGMTFKKGEEFLFVDVVEWLEEHST